jgi:hypothetical protein
VRQNAGLIVEKMLAAPEGTEAAEAIAGPEDIDENGVPIAAKPQRGGRR